MTIENWQSLHPEKQGVATYTLLMILKDVEGDEDIRGSGSEP